MAAAGLSATQTSKMERREFHELLHTREGVQQLLRIRLGIASFDLGSRIGQESVECVPEGPLYSYSQEQDSDAVAPGRDHGSPAVRQRSVNYLIDFWMKMN